MIGFRHGAATSVGRVRQVNEDSYLAVPPIFVVADGMGGHGSGDVASRIAIEEMRACAELRPLFAEAVLTALEHANQHIVERHDPNRMGTTLTGLAALETTVGGDHIMVFNIGDSRVYRLAGDRLEQLTVDHSEVQEMVLAGVITKEQARVHPRRNVITRALGSDAGLHPDRWLLPPISGDRYLVCSDGLFSELPDEVILALLSVGPPQQAAEALVAAANDAGGRDNVTAIVVDVESADADFSGADETTLPREQLHSDPRNTQPNGLPPHGSQPLPVQPRGSQQYTAQQYGAQPYDSQPRLRQGHPWPPSVTFLARRSQWRETDGPLPLCLAAAHDHPLYLPAAHDHARFTAYVAPGGK
jgi:PPM family protein phosphatase